ncbi:MAG: oxidoreductase [bacterium]
MKDKVILVTGAAGLIGKSISEFLSKQKAKLILCDMNTNVGMQMEKDMGSNSLFVKTDITKKKDIAVSIEKADSHFGKIDAAIHCAYPRSKTWGVRFEELEEESLKTDLYGQLGSAILFSQQILTYFEKKGSGNLIHFSSIYGTFTPKFDIYEGTEMTSPIEYSAIKSGINAVVKYLAKYYKGKNIQVNGISPGGVLDKQPESFLNKYKSHCNYKGMLNPEDLFSSILFLLSDNSKYITGQNIIIDDGWSV